MFIKNILIILLILNLTSGCVSISEINERAKGDGIPYIPGI